MNIDHAKRISVAEILSQLNIQPLKTSHGKLLYLSPIRKEKTPSFWVYKKNNRWHDYGIGQGGDPIDLVQAYLKHAKEDHTISDALRWLENMMSGRYEFRPVQTDESTDGQAGLILKSARIIQHVGLVHYLQKRGIPLEIARQHLKELHVRNRRTNKSFFALGFDNEEGGYELRNPFFKGCLGTKTVSFVRGNEARPDSIHVFEGFFDYLSAIAQLKGQRFRGDTIVLNSLSCLKQIAPYIQNYGYRTAYSWLDNDAAGERATASLSEFFKTQSNLTHQPMNRIYAPHKDVNAWHMHRLDLTL